MKKCFMYIDDVVFVFRDIARQKPKSIYDHPFMAMLKKAHDEYGMKIQLNVFLRTDFFYGSDEFTLLARSFNAMLDKINEQFETLERDAKRKQMLVDNMAHELRTPLTSIHGYAEFLEKAATTEEKRIIAAKYIMSESEDCKKFPKFCLTVRTVAETN